MMKTLLLSVAVSTIVFAPNAPTASQRESVKRVRMPSDRASALFDDSRVKSFLACVTSKAGQCALPDPSATDAAVTPPPPGAPPEFASTVYQLDIPCKGEKASASISITAEFVTMQRDPLNLTLSVSYRR